MSDRTTASRHRWGSKLARSAHSCHQRGRLLDGVLGGDGPGHLAVGGEVSEHEGDLLALAQAELGHRAHVLAMELDRGPKREAVRAGDGDELAVDAAHPGDDRAVAEADLEVHAHVDRAAQALDEPDDARVRAP